MGLVSHGDISKNGENKPRWRVGRGGAEGGGQDQEGRRDRGAGLLEMLKEEGNKEKGEGEEASGGGKRVDALRGGVLTLSLYSVSEYFKGFDFRKKPDEQFCRA